MSDGFQLIERAAWTMLIVGCVLAAMAIATPVISHGSP